MFPLLIVCIFSVTDATFLDSSLLTTLEHGIWPVAGNTDQLKNLLSISNVSQECKSAIGAVISGANHHELWAFQSE